jgi:hypothetical protein
VLMRMAANKRIWYYGLAVVIVLLVIWSIRPDPVEGWAVLMEMNDFPGGYEDFPVDFVDIQRMQDMLLSHGWQKDHIMVKKDNITQKTVEEGIEYLNHADKNDIALFYIASHSGYIAHDLNWNSVFPPLWDQVNTTKVLVVDSCDAGSFLPGTGMCIGAVSSGETAWTGLPEEGLPLIGSVFTYYFCGSMTGTVPVEEGFEKSVPEMRDYMKEVVYPAFKEKYPPEDHHNLYDPHPVIKDQYPGYLYLEVGRTAPGYLSLVLLGMLFALRYSQYWQSIVLYSDK